MDVEQTSAKETRGYGNVVPLENALNTLDSEKIERDSLEEGGCKTLTYQQNKEAAGIVHWSCYQKK